MSNREWDPPVSERQTSSLPAQHERRRREGKRVPSGHLREAQSDTERGSETMSTTERKVRMIEQPGRACELNTKGAGS